MGKPFVELTCEFRIKSDAELIEFEDLSDNLTVVGVFGLEFCCL